MRPTHIYVHVPFCARRCSYCDFAIAVRRNVPVEEYVAAVEQELALRFAGDDRWDVKTLYLGGGTPSRLGTAGIDRLMNALSRRVRIGADTEVTMEVNPDDVSPTDAIAWRAAGINRVSLGAQSFDDNVLRWMHRVHDAASIPRSVDVLRAAGFDDVSIDLIFALPAALERDWSVDLSRAIALDPTHVSLYGLTVEPHAPLGRWVARGETVEAPEERYEEEFLLADSMLASAGFEHYEVSNFGTSGHRARHNSAYWSGVAYAGIGPGAHEFDAPERRWNVRAYTDWVARLGAGKDPIDGSETLTDENRSAESVYLGLRTIDGLALVNGEAQHVEPWLAAGWGHRSGNRLRLTPAGWLRLDSLAADLTLFRSRC